MGIFTTPCTLIITIQNQTHRQTDRQRERERERERERDIVMSSIRSALNCSCCCGCCCNDVIIIIIIIIIVTIRRSLWLSAYAIWSLVDKIHEHSVLKRKVCRSSRCASIGPIYRHFDCRTFYRQCFV